MFSCGLYSLLIFTHFFLTDHFRFWDPIGLPCIIYPHIFNYIYLPPHFQWHVFGDCGGLQKLHLTFGEVVCGVFWGMFFIVVPLLNWISSFLRGFLHCDLDSGYVLFLVSSLLSCNPLCVHNLCHSVKTGDLNKLAFAWLTFIIHAHLALATH